MNPDDSILKVRRSILIAASPMRVWQEFVTHDRMNRWWGALVAVPTAGTPAGQRLVKFEPQVGGAIVMEVEMDGSPIRYGGVVTTFDAGRDLTFENDWMPNQGWTRPTYLTVRLTPALSGTLVELFHYGFEHTGGDVSSEHAGYEQGWGMTQLAALKRQVEQPA